MENTKNTSGNEQPKGTKNNPKIDLSDIFEDAEKCSHKTDESSSCKGLLLVMPASKWINNAKSRPIPRMLFNEFWYEGELCILFADTNLGKSILAVQIGNSICIQLPIKGFKLAAARQKVLYFDFELSDKQFEYRYSQEYANHYAFDDNFLRVEINPDATIPEKQDFEQYLYHSIDRAIVETGARVLIIDNLTYLKNETERAKDALPLMKHLKSLKSKYGLSILALAHTPKRDMTKPLTRNDLQGSKMLINFCDSAFAIGESSNDKNLRYLKQIKQRNTQLIYDADNVCICTIDKPDNFLQFEFVGLGTERQHLKELTENEKSGMETNILEMHRQGKSYREIAAELSTSHMTVKRVIDKCQKP